jgi:hypothetical protein
MSSECSLLHEDYEPGSGKVRVGFNNDNENMSCQTQEKSGKIFRPDERRSVTVETLTRSD